jgi:hypothetical protein
MREIFVSRFLCVKQNVKCASLCYVRKNIVSIGGKMIEDLRLQGNNGNILQKLFN